MEQQNNILDELMGLGGNLLASMPRTMPFSLPNGYFDELPAAIQDHIAGPSLDIATALPFNIPDDYFEQLPTRLLQRLAEECLKEQPRTMPYQVAPGYFQQLPAQMLAAAKNSEPPAQKRMALGGGWLKQLRWVAAAVLVLGIGTGSYLSFYQHHAPHIQTTADAQRALNKVPVNTVSEYVQQSMADYDSYTQTPGNVNSSNIQVSTRQLKDEDIRQYLDENGWN